MSDNSKHEGFQTLIIEDQTIYEGYAHGPERGLMSALLFDGVQSYLTYCLSPSMSSRGKYFEAYNWVHHQDAEYIFSFDNVCEALGIDADGLRLGLQNFIHSNQIETEQNGYKRARRHG